METLNNGHTGKEKKLSNQALRTPSHSDDSPKSSPSPKGHTARTPLYKAASADSRENLRPPHVPGRGSVVVLWPMR